MRKNNDARRVILEHLEKSNGHACRKALKQALYDAGLIVQSQNVSNYLRMMKKENLIISAGTDDYWIPDDFEDGAARLIARLPYRTSTAGRILHFMLSHRFVGPREAFRALRGDDLKSQHTVRLNFKTLHKEGHVRRICKGVYTLSEALLGSVGLKDVLAKPVPSIRDAANSHEAILRLLADLGPSPINLLWTLCREQGRKEGFRHVAHALLRMTQHGTTAQKSRGLFSLPK